MIQMMMWPLIEIEDLNGYFDNLAAAAPNKKWVLEDLVSNIATHTTSNT